jgi:hypothetical protein
MKKSGSKAAKNKGRGLKPLDKPSIDYTQFKPDLSASDIQKLLRRKPVSLPFAPIETLSSSKLTGPGAWLEFRNVELLATWEGSPAILYGTDQQIGQSMIAMRFLPYAYGITSPANYVVEFFIDTGPATFLLEGLNPSLHPINGGERVLNGKTRASLLFENLDPAGFYASLKLQSGSGWYWYSTRVRFPDLVVAPNVAFS